MPSFTLLPETTLRARHLPAGEHVGNVTSMLDEPRDTVLDELVRAGAVVDVTDTGTDPTARPRK